MTKKSNFTFSQSRSLKDYKGFIFDLDGTLLDSKEDIVLATNATIEAMGGMRLDPKKIASFVGRGVRDLIVNALSHLPNADAKSAEDFFTQYYLQNGTRYSRFFSGADEFLGLLQKQGLPCAILTNKPQIYTDKILHDLGKSHYFSVILGAENGFLHKPDPKGLLSILSGWNIDPSQILYFGDSAVDAKTAKNAGADLALYLDGFATEGELSPYLQQAVCVFDDYLELYNHFQSVFR